MSLTAVLATTFERVIAIFPRLLVTPWTDRGALWRVGRAPEFLEPGWKWYWPLTTDIDTVNVEQEQVTSPNQGPLTTKDDYALQIDTMMVYKVGDHRLWFTIGADMEETLNEHMMRAARDYVMSTDYEYLRDHTAEVSDELADEIQALLLKYGVEVLSVGITSFAATQHFTIAGDGLQHAT